MPSIEDWAAKAARRILRDFEEKPHPTESRVAAIIAVHAAPLVKLIQESRVEHHPCCVGHQDQDDDICNCGSGEWNRYIRKILAGV